MRRLAGALLSACLALTSAASAATPPPASALGPGDRERLVAGDVVSRPLKFSREGNSYVGGVAYQVVDASPEVVLAALADVSNWPEALPRTKSARLLGYEGGLTRVELVQGASLLQARYAIVLERSADGQSMRFWLDPRHPHDLRDVWGFFRVQSFVGSRSLVTVGAAVDLGEGFAQALFEEKIAAVISRAPSKIRAFVEPRALALSGSDR
jgi:Polyketide cyclase / dehydrase and lipid transport